MAKQTKNELKSFDLARFFVHFIQNAGLLNSTVIEQPFWRWSYYYYIVIWSSRKSPFFLKILYLDAAEIVELLVFLHSCTLDLEVHFKYKFCSLRIVSKAKVFRIDFTIFTINTKGLML